MVRSNTGLLIIDRWTPISNFIYGYFGDGIHPFEMYKLNEIANLRNDVTPDLTIVLDVKQEDLIKRYEKARSENREMNRLDERDLEFKSKIRTGYQNIDLFFPEYIIAHIPTDGTINEVFETVINTIYAYIGY